MKTYERHGHTASLKRTPEYYAWQNMRSRCTNSKRKDWPQYGGRGITVCERWMNSFEAFFSDMGPRPSGEHSLDRYPNQDGNYEPSNCRWATKDEQMQNTRATARIAFNGETMGLAAWARRVGINKQSLRDRLDRGWPLEKALTTGATKQWWGLQRKS